MSFIRTICIAFLAFGMAALPALADCPYDHFLVGQDEGRLLLDTSQLYRHWNANWSTNSDPYGQEYYEFTEMYGGGYIRVEPGFSQNTDPAFALNGIQAVDYNILVERIYATPGISLFDDLMQPILTDDGATFPLSDYANHHVHVRYYLPDDLDPTLPYTVSYRLTDTTGTYADSEIYTFNFGAAPENDPGDANGDGSVNLDDFIILKQNYGKSTGASWSEGDFNDDGTVNLDDFIILKQNYGS